MVSVRNIIQSIKKPASEINTITVDIITEIQKNHPELKRRIIQKGIAEGSLSVNSKKTLETEIKIYPGIRVEFIGKLVNFEIFKFQNKIDSFVDAVCREKFHKSFDQLVGETDCLCGYVIDLFSEINISSEEIANSKYFSDILKWLKHFYKTYFTPRDEKRMPEDREVIHQLISLRENAYSRLNAIVTSLEQNFYEGNINKLYRDMRSLLNDDYTFKLLVSPVMETQVDYISFVQKVNSIYTRVEQESNSFHRVRICLDAINEYDQMLKNNFVIEDKASKLFVRFVNHYLKKCKALAGINKKGKAELSLVPEVRSYDFNDDNMVVHGYLFNRGNGIARYVTVSVTNPIGINVSQNTITDIIAPKEKLKIKFSLLKLDKIFTSEQQLNLRLNLKWKNEVDEVSEFQVDNFLIKKQNVKLPWDEIKNTSPYNISKVTDITKLFGRDKLISKLRNNIENAQTVESFVLHGQKRVGKSSIVTTLENIYSIDKNVHFIYTEVTDRKATDPILTFNQIGQHIAKALVKDFAIKNELPFESLPIPSINGSLTPLIDLIDELHEKNPRSKIIVAIDEFDELNEEFFENTTIGNVFASNIGKGLVGKKFVGVILVGSENTELKTKQAMRLNAFKFIRVDSFNKETEFEEYCQIIKNPTKECVEFSAEVLDLIYEYSNGNPFYTNLICDKIFSEAYEKRISYVDEDFVAPIFDRIVDLLSTKDFEHFWKDKAIEETIANRKTFSRRSRVLIAYAEAKNENKYLKWTEVRKKIKKNGAFNISDVQFEDTYHEFIQRGIFFVQNDDAILVKPKLFEAWLLKIGLYQIAAQLEDSDYLIEEMKEDEKLKISETELTSLQQVLFSTESGQKYKQLKAFFDQFENNREKTLIVDLIKQMKVISSEEKISFLRQIYRRIWPEISIGIGEQNIRKDAEVLSIGESFIQNEEFFENIIRDTFKLSSARTLKNGNDFVKIEEDIRQIIIYEPLIDCPYYYRNSVSTILKKINPGLVNKVKIHILCFVITEEAYKEISSLLKSNFNFEFEIHSLQTYPRVDIAPYVNSLTFVNDKTIRCLSKFYENISDGSCLVKIGELIPYQCFPFLWCQNEKFQSLFKSNYSYNNYKKRMQLSDQLKGLSINSESKKIELKASMLNPAVNWKKIYELTKTLKKTQNLQQNENNERTKMEIEKLWKLDLDSDERSKFSSAVKFSISKNLSAFANTSGGEIYVGIEDDFTIAGITPDFKEGESEENIRKAFTELIKKYIGLSQLEYFSISILPLNIELKVIKIDIQESPSDVWVRCDEFGNSIPEGNLIYIRSEFGTEKLNPMDYKHWREQRDQKYK